MPLRLIEPAVEVVFEAAGGSNDESCSTTDGFELRAFGESTADQRRSAFALGEVAIVIENLHGEFTRGQEDEGSGALGSFRHALDERDEEAEGFAGAGLGGGENVAAFEGGRNGSSLDRGGGDEIGGGNLLLQSRRKVEFRKVFQCVPCSGWFGIPSGLVG